MTLTRFLIINADDLGISAEVNRGVFTGYEHGVVTDSSLLINGAHSQDAIAMLKSNPHFPVGIHIDLDPLLGWKSPGKEKFTRQKLHQLMSKSAFVKKIEGEIHEQIETFLDTGLIPSHIDTHHHVHGFLSIFESLIEAMDRYKIKALRFSKTGYALLGREDILFTSETAQWMKEILRDKGIVYPQLLIDPLSPFSLRELPTGVTELMVHPSIRGDQWRQRDFEMIMDPRFMNTLHDEGIQLIGFAEIDTP
jgi:predicted glycoside hydrolase/deacetylase ChbG (UPF0249 family)